MYLYRRKFIDKILAMGFFERIFGSESTNEVQPAIRFGRYSDAYKSSKQYDAWDKSLEKFEEGAYLDAYRDFFSYLRDEEEDNVRFWDMEGGIAFELFQGSKKLCGFADVRKVVVSAKVVRAETLNIGFMRQLIEQNYDLKYSRFSLDNDNNITIQFDTYTLDGSPYKLYYAFKEVATKADKHDDLLLDEFDSLKALEVDHLRELNQVEKIAKYNYIFKEIQEVLEGLEKEGPKLSQYPGGIAYWLLHLCYKLDYLTKPEGFMMETLERIHRMYFTNDGKSTDKKIAIIRRDLKKLLNRPREEYFKEMYEVTSTFGITSPVNHDRVVSFIDGELGNMDWYQENGYSQIALAVPGYIIGYCLFNYALPFKLRRLTILLL